MTLTNTLAYYCTVLITAKKVLYAFSKAKAYRLGALARLHYINRLLALPTNIRLGWKLLNMTNTLAYYGKVL
jgi:hypothetical protein